MAGSNPQLAIRIAANTDELKRNLAEGRAAIEALGPSVAKMTAAWNTNAAAVVQKANNITAALQGVSLGTLTASDAAKNLKALDIALAQIKASGAPIPPLMQQTADQLRQVSGAASAGVAPVQSLTSKLQGVAGTLGLAFGGVAVVAGLKSMVSGVFTYASSIDDLSKKMGVSATAAQQWKFAAEQTGASLEDVDKSVRKLSIGLAGGEASVKKSLDAVGLSFDSVRAMSPEAAFDATVAAIAKIPDPMTQARVAMELFGKSGAELLPAIREGFSDIAQSAKTMSDETIKRLAEAEDAWQRLWTNVTIWTGEAVSNLLTKLSVVTTGFSAWKTLFTEGWNPEKGMPEAVKSLTQGIDRSGLAAAATIPPMRSAMEIMKEMTPEFDRQRTAVNAAVTAQDAYNKKIADMARQYGGGTLKAQIADIQAAVTATGGASKLTAFEYAALGKQLDDLKAKGASLPNSLHQIWLAHETLNPSIKVTVADYKALAAAMKLVPSIQLGAAPTIAALPFKPMTAAEWKNILNLGAIGPLGAAPAADFGFVFSDSLSKALAGLGAVIVGALQGGGNVGASVGASLGASIGADLGASITKSLTASLGAGLASAIGGLAGPLGALAGSLLGGLFDKIGGLFKNQGRDDAKAFAASFGGFDALQAKMLSLGPAYDKLWRDLTQNTKGPAQVAAAIKAIEDAFRAQEAAAASAAGASATAFAGPAGAAGFPTKAQLQQAAKDAEETYRYIKDSGEYTAASVDEAFQRWQDSLIAAGDAGAAALKKIDAEMKSLQDSIAMEAPEEVMGVIETEQRARLKALEEEKAATLVKIEEEQRAEEAAAAAAATSAEKAFDKTLADAKLLDGEMRRIFSQGYDIPFRFSGMPGGSGTPGPGYGGPQADGGDYRVDKPTWFMAGEAGPERATFTPLRGGGGGGGGDQTIIVHVDGEVIARAAAKGMPRYLKLHGRGR